MTMYPDQPTSLEGRCNKNLQGRRAARGQAGEATILERHILQSPHEWNIQRSLYPSSNLYLQQYQVGIDNSICLQVPLQTIMSLEAHVAQVNPKCCNHCHEKNNGSNFSWSQVKILHIKNTTCSLNLITWKGIFVFNKEILWPSTSNKELSKGKKLSGFRDCCCGPPKSWIVR